MSVQPVRFTMGCTSSRDRVSKKNSKSDPINPQTGPNLPIIDPGDSQFILPTLSVNFEEAANRAGIFRPRVNLMTESSSTDLTCSYPERQGAVQPYLSEIKRFSLDQHLPDSTSESKASVRFSLRNSERANQLSVPDNVYKGINEGDSPIWRSGIDRSEESQKRNSAAERIKNSPPGKSAFREIAKWKSSEVERFDSE